MGGLILLLGLGALVIAAAKNRPSTGHDTFVRSWNRVPSLTTTPGKRYAYSITPLPTNADPALLDASSQAADMIARQAAPSQPMTVYTADMTPPAEWPADDWHGAKNRILFTANSVIVFPPILDARLYEHT